jgi:hypothetical protein
MSPGVFVPAPVHTVRVLVPVRRALGANPRAGSLDLAAGLLEWAYSGSGEAGLSAEWFVAMLRALSGVRPISSSLRQRKYCLAELAFAAGRVKRPPA